MAKLTGGGFTNLPPEKKTLKASSCERTNAAFAQRRRRAGRRPVRAGAGECRDRRGARHLPDLHQVGNNVPFYSYRRGTEQQAQRTQPHLPRGHADALQRSEGCSEVGGLFLHPGERAGGLGMLLARSRYLFIAAHRARFADRSSPSCAG
jgi:arginine N-succinyltransferase